MKEMINDPARGINNERTMKDEFEIILGVLSVMKDELNISSPSPMSYERN